MGKYGYVVNWAMKVLEILKLVQIVQNGHVYIQLMKQHIPVINIERQAKMANLTNFALFCANCL